MTIHLTTAAHRFQFSLSRLGWAVSLAAVSCAAARIWMLASEPHSVAWFVSAILTSTCCAGAAAGLLLSRRAAAIGMTAGIALGVWFTWSFFHDGL